MSSFMHTAAALVSEALEMPPGKKRLMALEGAILVLKAARMDEAEHLEDNVNRTLQVADYDPFNVSPFTPDRVLPAAMPTEVRVRELEKALALMLPWVKFWFNTTPNPSSDIWATIKNAEAVLHGQLATPEKG